MISKIELLVKHFSNFYFKEGDSSFIHNKTEEIDDNRLSSKIEEFVSDIINCNTYDSLVIFQQYLDKDEIIRVNEIWNHKRIKTLFSNIFNNLESLKYNFNQIKTRSRTKENGEKIVSTYYNYIETNTNKKLDDNQIHSSQNNKILIKFEDCLPKKLNKKIIKEFFDLSFPQFKGEFMRNFLFDEYLKETFDKICY